jgi:hypothetical protein
MNARSQRISLSFFSLVIHKIAVPNWFRGFRWSDHENMSSDACIILLCMCHSAMILC